MFRTKVFDRVKVIFAFALLLSTFAWGSGAIAHAAGNDAQDSHSSGAVYTLTNEAAGNRVVAFDRASDGTLAPDGVYLTGGLGSGSGLGSQGAVILSQDNRKLFAVNAGSDSISYFEVRRGGLRHAGTRRPSIQEDRARTALPLAAAVLGAGQVEVVAQDAEQTSLRVGLDAVSGAVDGEFGRGHGTSSPC